MTRLRRWLKRIALGFVVLLLLLVVAWFFRWQLLSGPIRNAVRDVLADQGLRIHIEEFSGSLLADVTATGIRTEATTDRPIVRTGTIESARITFSLPGLLRGRDDWLREIEIDGVVAVVDVEAPPPASPEADGAAGDSLLPRRVRVTNADVTILAGPDRLTVTDGEVVADLVSKSELHGTATAGSVTAQVDGEPYELGSPRAAVDFDGETLTVLTGKSRHEAVHADLSRIHEGHVAAVLDLPILGGEVKGTVESDITTGRGRVTTARLTLRELRPKVLLRFLPGLKADLELLSGTAHATVGEVVSPWWASVTGGFDVRLTRPVVDRWVADSLEVAGTFDRGRIEVTTGRVTGPGGGETTVAGWLRLGDEPSFDARVGLAGFDATELKLPLDGKTARGSLSGSVRASGTFSTPGFEVDLKIDRPAFGDWTADRVEFAGSGTLEAATLSGLTIVRGEDRISLAGSVAFGETLRFETSGDVTVASGAKLAALFDLELPARLDPAVTLRFRARTREDGATTATVFDLSIRTGLGTATSAGVDVVLPPFTEDFEPGAIAVSGTVGLTGLTPERFTGRLDLPDVASGGLTGEVRVAGTLANPLADLTLRGESIEFRPPERDPILADRVTLAARLDESGVALTELFVGGAAWRLTASGRLDWNPFATAAGPVGAAPLSGRAELVDVPLELGGALPGLAVARGKTSAVATVSGTLDAPRADGSIVLTAEELRPEDPDVPAVLDLRLGLTLSGGDATGVRVEATPSSAEVLGGKVALTHASVRIDFDPLRLVEPLASLTVTGIDAGRLARDYAGTPDVEGQLGATLDLERGPAIRATVRSDDIRIRQVEDLAELSAPGSLDLVAEWRDGRLNVTGGSIAKGEVRLDVNARDLPVEIAFDPPIFRLPPDGKLDVAATVNRVDLAKIAGHLDLRFSGQADLALAVRGTYAKPEPQVEVTIRDGVYRAPGAVRIDEVNGKLRLRGDRGGEITLHVDGIEARLGRGVVTLAEGGFARTAVDEAGDRQLTGVDLRVFGKNLLLVRQRTMLIRGTPDLRLSYSDGPGWWLTGEFDLRSLRYTQRIELLSRQPSLAPLPLTEHPFLRDLNLNVTVTAPKESIRIRNNLLDAEFGGRLRVTGTPAVPRPEGRIIADRGTVRLPMVTMRILNATAEFRSEMPLQPRLDATLTTIINRINVSLAAKGPVNNLEVNARSMPALSEEDVITLLATGELPADVDTGTAAGVAANLLYRQIVSEMGGADPDDEPTAIEDLASRVEEFTVDTASLFNGGATAWRATFRVAGDWLYLRADQTTSENYGLDMLIRLSFQ